MVKQFAIFIYIFLLIQNTQAQNTIEASKKPRPFLLPEFEIVTPTFLGNNQRNYYGNLAPDSLNINWSLYLGSGKTVISRKLGERIWAGAGWTGQPLLVNENSNLFIIQGAYDHHLKKINAKTGKLVWQYTFDDVVKGTGTIWVNPDTSETENKIVILQGSRLGVGNYLDSKYIPSLRAISYFTGKELWRLDVKWTASYSRDCDGSALIYNDTAYLGLENSLFTKFNPDYRKAVLKDSMLQPMIYKETCLYTKKDVIAHGGTGNVVTESSPSMLDSVIYIASGSGHIFGYSLKEDTITWDFYIGSDIDGSAIITSDSCIIVTVEKQYIAGHGGTFKLDPRKPADEAVIWFFPVEDKEYGSWEGGIIGSAAVNDTYRTDGQPFLCAFGAIDGNLYVVEHTIIDSTKLVKGPDDKHLYPTPKLIFKYNTGPSISTPLIVNNKIIATGYNGIYLFTFNTDLNFYLLDHFEASFESTPVVYNKKIFVASRDGYFYCLGE